MQCYRHHAQYSGKHAQHSWWCLNTHTHTPPPPHTHTHTHPHTHTHTHTHTYMHTHTQGNYERAVEYFDRCYKICTELGDTDALHVARAHYGVAKSHQLMGRYTTCVQDTRTLQELVLWKDTRVQPSDNTRVQPSDNTRVNTTHS